MIDLTRFFEKVSPEPNTGCWLWTGSLHVLGYGQVTYKGKLWKAHRFAWLAWYGPIPPKMSVCHKCDTRSCVNPDHLFLGTHGENMADMSAKGRTRWGDNTGQRNGMAALTDDKVRQIRSLKAAGIKQIEIAKQFGVSPMTISRAVTGKAWTHV
jgi:hypothetical protein